MTKRKSSKGQTTIYKPLRCLVHLYLQFFVRGRMSYLRYLRYLCLFTYSGVHRILCCVLCTLCCLFVSIAIFWFTLQYSLTFIYIENYRSSNTKPTKNRGWTHLLPLSLCMSTQYTMDTTIRKQTQTTRTPQKPGWTWMLWKYPLVFRVSGHFVLLRYLFTYTCVQHDIISHDVKVV